MVLGELRNAEKFERMPRAAGTSASKDMAGLDKVGSGVGMLVVDG